MMIIPYRLPVIYSKIMVGMFSQISEADFCLSLEALVMSTMGIAASFVMCTVYKLSVGFCLPECLVFADFPPGVL